MNSYLYIIILIDTFLCVLLFFNVCLCLRWRRRVRDTQIALDEMASTFDDRPVEKSPLEKKVDGRSTSV